MCQSHHWLDFKQRGFTTNHHMQDTNGDSLLCCCWASPNMWHPQESFGTVWSHQVGFLVKTHKHLAVQGLHFQQKLLFQRQSHGRLHWLFVVFPIHKSVLIVVLMPWTLIFKIFVEFICMGIGQSEGPCASPTIGWISSSVASPQTITCKTPMVTVFLLLLGIP